MHATACQPFARLRCGRGAAGPAGPARLAVACFVLSFCGLSVVGPHRAAAAEPACTDAVCVAAEAQALLRRGAAAEALALLKAQAPAWPDAHELAVLTGVAYVQSGNVFWGIRTLAARLAADPADCEARAWLGHAYLQQAALEPARDVLATRCADAAGEARLALLRTRERLLAGDRPGALAAVAEARAAKAAYPADRAALPGLTREAFPDAMAEVAWRLDAAVGYASNALLGSPVDPAGGTREPGSALLQLDGFVQLVPAVHPLVRPLAEGQLRLLRLFAAEVSGLSYFIFTGRAGLVLGRALPRFVLAYRPDLLLLSEGDKYDAGPVWFSEGHRGEFEAELASWMLLFGGGGRRNFRDRARSRYEVDLGLGGRAPAAPWLTFVWAAAGRVYRAEEPAYHAFGGSALVSAQFRMPKDFLARAGLSFAVDAYPDSAGYALFGGTADRRDLFVKTTATFLSPAWHGGRLGLSYDFSNRDSTASAYGFRDHRVLFRVTWGGERDFGLPATSAGLPLADLPWAGTASGGGSVERVQDLLRQDEQVQRSSSCVQ